MINTQEYKNNPVQDNIGKKVVHIPEGVCTITELCTMKNDAGEEREFYKLTSVKNESLAVYVPLDSAEKHMRNLRSREEIEEILKSCKTAKPGWDSSEAKRVEKRRKALQEDDGIAIAKLIKSYHRRREHSNLSVVDSNWLKKAEQFLVSEMEEVLQVDYQKVLSEITG